MKKLTDKLTYAPTWYVYTNDTHTDRVIVELLTIDGRHDEDFLQSATVTDIQHEVRLWRVKKDDVDALKRAKKNKALIFRTYLQLYPGGPIFSADQNMPSHGSRKIVLLVSGKRGPEELREVANRETSHKKMVSYLVLYPEDPALTRDLLRRGFIQEVHLYDGLIPTDLRELLDYATERNIRVVGVGTIAEAALRTLHGGEQKRRRAA